MSNSHSGFAKRVGLPSWPDWPSKLVVSDTFHRTPLLVARVHRRAGWISHSQGAGAQNPPPKTHPFFSGSSLALSRLPDGDVVLGTGNGVLARISAPGTAVQLASATAGHTGTNAGRPRGQLGGVVFTRCFTCWTSQKSLGGFVFFIFDLTFFGF